MEGHILTARLRLRPWRPDDLEPLSAIFAKAEVWKYPFGRGFSAEETENYLDRLISSHESAESKPCAAEDRWTRQLLGYIALAPPDWLPEIMPAVEIGWRLDPPYWRRGLATEGARALMNYGFNDMGLLEIVSIYEPDNVASGRVIEKLGMHFDRETRHPFFNVPIHIYRLSRDEWGRDQ